MPGYTMKRGAAPKFKDLGSSPGKKLTGGQYKLDKNKDGELSKADFDMMNNSPADMHSPAKNYKNPQDYKVFMMGNEATPVKKYKNAGQRKAAHAAMAEKASGTKYASPAKNKGGREVVEEYASGKKEVKVKGDNRSSDELLALANKAEADGALDSAKKMREKAKTKKSETKRAKDYLSKA